MGLPATLALNTQILAYGDTGSPSNPRYRYVDWQRAAPNTSVENVKTVSYVIDPGDTATLFSGTRSISADGSTAWDLTISPLGGSRYRFTNSSGTSPALRADRGLSMNGAVITIVLNTNDTVTVSTDTGDFTDVQVGDIVFIPGTSTGDDANVFSASNEGYWEVLGVSGASMTMTRLTGEDFVGVTDSATLTANSQLQAFSSEGVQVGDTVEISYGFATPVLRSFEVSEVNPKWFEVVSSAPLAEQSGVIPTSSGILFYSQAKRFIYVEADQECALQLNGSAEVTHRLSPWVAGSTTNVAQFMNTGPTWALGVVNKSASKLNLLVISAE